MSFLLSSQPAIGQHLQQVEPKAFHKLAGLSKVSHFSMDFLHIFQVTRVLGQELIQGFLQPFLLRSGQGPFHELGVKINSEEGPKGTSPKSFFSVWAFLS